MTTVTLNKDSTLAVEHFEHKLAFEIGPVELARTIESKQRIQVIDLRTPELFSKGRVPTASNVDYDSLEQHASTLDPNVTTVVYCYNITCQLSAKAALLLAKKGYKVRELIGGFDQWVQSGAQVEDKSSSTSCACG